MKLQTKISVNCRRASGFTLVEMMIVLALITILASLAAPSFYRVQLRETSREYANAVANQLKVAQTEARVQGQPLLVTISPGNGFESRGSIRIQKGTPFCRNALSTTVESDGFCSDRTKPQPPVNCAELSQQYHRPEFKAETIKVVDPQSVSADNYIAGTSYGDSEVVICFSPDGKVLDKDGRILRDQFGSLCSGENFVIFTAYTNGQTPTPFGQLFDLAKCSRGGSIGETDRDSANLYRIVLPYNGGIHTTR